MPLARAMRDLLGQLIIGAGTSYVFDNTNAHLLVGDSTQGAGLAGIMPTSWNAMGSSGANWAQSSMDAGYPQYSVTSDANTPAMIFRSTFGTAAANFHWQEWGVRNGAGSGTATSSGVMLNHVTADLGTKTNVQTWQLTCVITPTT